MATTRKTAVRWGILGAAEIARKNWKAIRNSGNGVVVAVASREAGRAREWVKRCQEEAPMGVEPRVMGSYAELVEDPEVEAVYVPIPTGIRKEWVLRAARAGKHVVCEKPCASSEADLIEMQEACRGNGVQFMDGVMFVHSGRMAAMGRVLSDGESVGAVRRISTAFSFQAGPEFERTNIRAQGALEPLGCLGDLGWYCVRFSLWAMGWRLPRRVRGWMLGELQGVGGGGAVPMEFTGDLAYDDGVSAGFYCSFRTELQQWAHVSGSRGALWLEDFVIPHFGSELRFWVGRPEYRVTGCDFNMEPGTQRHGVREYSNSHPTAHESNLFREFAEQVRSGKLNEDWCRQALATQRVIERCLESARSGGGWVTVPELGGVRG